MRLTGKSKEVLRILARRRWVKSSAIERTLDATGATVRYHVRTLRRNGATIAEGGRGYKLTANIALLQSTVVNFDLRINSMTITSDIMIETIQLLKQAAKVRNAKRKRK